MDKRSLGLDVGRASSSSRRWELLVESIPGLRVYLRSLVRSSEAVDDLIQEISLKILQSDAPVDDPAGFFTWCCGVARQVVARESRVRRSSPELSLDGADDDTPDRKSNPENHVDVCQQLERAVGGLDGAALNLLVRRYVLEESAKDLAGELAQSPTALRVRLLRLRSSARRARM